MMKNLALVFLLAIGLMWSDRALATHISGGDLTYDCLGGNQYSVTLTLYRDCSGITLPNSQTITLESSCTLQAASLALINPGGTEVTTVCAAMQSQTTCNGGNLVGLESWIYKAVVTIPSCADWNIFWTTCCRNGTTNSTNSNGSSLYINATLDNINTTCNDSPIFTTDPVPFFCLGVPFIYEYGVYDAQGDSLVFSLVNALDNANTPLQYAVGYSPAQPMAGITINPATGQLSATPNALGNFIVVVQVDQYAANGTFIGSIKRDVQFWVVSCAGNNAPVVAIGGISSVTGASVVDSTTVLACAGSNFCMSVQVSDPDGDTLTVTSNSGLLLPGSSFSHSGTTALTLNLCWTPPPGASGMYSFTATVSDNSCPVPSHIYLTFYIKVAGQTIAGADQVTCGGQAVPLSVTGGTTFTWSVVSGSPIVVGNNMSCDVCQQPMANPAATTIYQVQSNLPGACISTDTVTVTVNPDFAFTSTQESTVACFLDTIDFSVTPAPGPTYTYSWTPGIFLNDSTSANPQAIMNESGDFNFVVTVASSLGCTKFDTLLLAVSPVPSFDVSVTGDTSLCEGTSTELGLSYAAVGTVPCNFKLDLIDTFGDGWNGGSLDVYSNSTLIGNYAAAGFGSEFDFWALFGDTLTLEYSAANWENENLYSLLNDQGEILFSDGPNPNTGVVYEAVVTCLYDNFQPFSYVWSPAGSINDPTAANPLVSPASDQLYTVVVTDTVCGFTDSATVIIDVVPGFELNMLIPSDTVCLNQLTQLQAIPDTAGTYTYVWSPNTWLSDVNIADPTFSISVSGNESFYVLADNGLGCQVEDSISVFVRNGFVPNVSLLGDSVFCQGDTVELTATISPVTSPCQYTLDLIDTFGDGWNGASLTVYREDTLAGVLAATGFGSTFQITINEGDELEFYYTSGNYENEVIYNFLDPWGNLLFTDGTFPDTGYVYIDTLTCTPPYTSQWSPLGLLNADTGLNVIALPTGDTTVSFTVVDPFSGCVATETIHLVYGGLIDATIDPATDLCETADPIMLTAATAGGTWSGAGVTNSSNGTFNPATVAPGNHIVWYSVSNSNCSDIDTVLMHVIPAPATPTVSNTTVCAGADHLLTATGVSGTVMWYGDMQLTNPVGTGNPLNLGAGPTTVYWVAQTDLGCTSTPASFTVTVQPVPSGSAIIGPVTVDEFDQRNYSVSQNIGSTYLWTVTGGSVLNGQGTNAITVNWGLSGVGSVSMIETSAAGCASDTAELTVQIGPNAIGEFERTATLQLFPNPMSESATLVIQGTSGSVTVELLDVTGKLLRTWPTVPAGKLEISREELASGLYFIRVTANDPEPGVKVLPVIVN